MNKLSVLPVKNDFREVTLSNGRVVSRAERQYHVLTEAGTVVAARKADGCLLDPEMNDLVLVSHGGRAGGFILSVLEKTGGRSRTSIPGKADVAAEEFNLTAERQASIEAPQIRLEGLQGTMNFLGLDLQTARLDATMEQGRVSAGRLNVIMDRLTQHARNCFRWVENLDQVKAGRISRMVKERFSLTSRNTSIRAQEQVTVDGDQINLG